MKTMTFKKPRYVGTKADLIGLAAMSGLTSYRDKERRKAIGEKLIGDKVFLIRAGHNRAILTDDTPPKDLPEHFVLEGAGTIRWVGQDGKIIITVEEDK